MAHESFSGAILEPPRRHSAISSIKEFWYLPEMDVNDAGFEDDGSLLRLMVAGEERGFVALYRKYHSQSIGFLSRSVGSGMSRRR
jgi:hypothetical protein